MIAVDNDEKARQAKARREAIRALLLGHMAQLSDGTGKSWPSLEECPWDTVLQSSLVVPSSGVSATAEMTPEAYFSLLIEFDLLDTHRALHLS